MKSRALRAGALALVLSAAAAIAWSHRPASAEAAMTSEESACRAELAAQRELMIERLHRYRTAGAFVENPDRTGGRGHFLFDAQGRPCPLASIIIDAGRRDLVEQAARENNNVKVVDLEDGPVVDWILASGLTQEECVLIQRPSRSGGDAPPEQRREEADSIATSLERVERQLREQTQESLALAVRRLLAARRG